MNKGLLIRAVSEMPGDVASSPSSKRQRGQSPRIDDEEVAVPHLSQTQLEFKFFTRKTPQATISTPDERKGYCLQEKNRKKHLDGCRLF